MNLNAATRKLIPKPCLNPPILQYINTHLLILPISPPKSHCSFHQISLTVLELVFRVVITGLIENKMQIGKGKRYALLLAAKNSDYVKKVHGGYFNLFVKAFGEEGEQWDLFRVVEGEFPDIEHLENYDGFVISGSPFDAFGHDLWILELCSLLQILHFKHKKILGICFGHQVGFLLFLNLC